MFPNKPKNDVEYFFIMYHQNACSRGLREKYILRTVCWKYFLEKTYIFMSLIIFLHLIDLLVHLIALLVRFTVFKL